MINTKPLRQFAALPTPGELTRISELLNDRGFASLRQRDSKLLPFLPTISTCLKRGLSLEKTCKFLEIAHRVKVHRSSLSRFILKNPMLTTSLDEISQNTDTIFY